ncbi:hypothetical protein [Aureimonas sp. AU4]|uniref:hypothetical protein n=1 Tax=Aureimonas sp. AU4 TaxID=1638163 RepID=UPI000705A7D2|nr:hypothetical protein [Aureimonas sp. AU4]BAT30612.1 hypothetical protein [Aureimonas sp. AU4]
MTAINAFLRRDRGVLMTDGAFYSAAGVPLGFGSKTVSIPNLHMAIAARGCSAIAPSLAHHMSIGFRDIDDVAGRGEEFLGGWALGAAEFLANAGFPDFELHMMGWSAKDERPRHLVFTTRAGGDWKAGELTEIEGYVLCPYLEDNEAFEALPKLGLFVSDPQFCETFDPKMHGVPIMMAQRRQIDELDGHEENGRVSVVGGHVEVTEITADGISQRVLHRWADQVGVAMTEPEALSPKDVLRARIAERNRRVADALRTAA